VSPNMSTICNAQLVLIIASKTGHGHGRCAVDLAATMWGQMQDWANQVPVITTLINFFL